MVIKCNVKTFCDVKVINFKFNRYKFNHVKN